jgi:hypothetical protein
MGTDSYLWGDFNWSQEVKMEEQKEKKGCLEDGIIHPDGTEDCIDIYCSKCVDGEWETNPSIGTLIDPSEVL